MARETGQGIVCGRSVRCDVPAGSCRGLRTVGQPFFTGIQQIDWCCSARLAASGPCRISQGHASKTRHAADHDRSFLRFRGPKSPHSRVQASCRAEPWRLAQDGCRLMQQAHHARRRFHSRQLCKDRFPALGRRYGVAHNSTGPTSVSIDLEIRKGAGARPEDQLRQRSTLG